MVEICTINKKKSGNENENENDGKDNYVKAL